MVNDKRFGLGMGNEAMEEVGGALEMDACGIEYFVEQEHEKKY